MSKQAGKNFKVVSKVEKKTKGKNTQEATHTETDTEKKNTKKVQTVVASTSSNRKHRNLARASTPQTNPTSVQKKSKPTPVAAKSAASSAGNSKRSASELKSTGGRGSDSLDVTVDLDRSARDDSAYEQLRCYIVFNFNVVEVEFKRLSWEVLPLKLTNQSRAIVNVNSILVTYLLGVNLRSNKVAMALADALMHLGRLNRRILKSDFADICSPLIDLQKCLKQLDVVRVRKSTVDLGLATAQAYNAAIGQLIEVRNRCDISKNSDNTNHRLDKLRKARDLDDLMGVISRVLKGSLNGDSPQSLEESDLGAAGGKDTEATGGSDTASSANDSDDSPISQKKAADSSNGSCAEEEASGSEDDTDEGKGESSTAQYSRTVRNIFKKYDQNVYDAKTMSKIFKEFYELHPGANIISQNFLKICLDTVAQTVIPDQEMVEAMVNKTSAAVSHKQMWEWLYTKGTMTKKLCRVSGKVEVCRDNVIDKLIEMDLVKEV